MTTPAFLTTVSRSDAETPLVVHLVYRFAIGGLENGLVNLINHMPAERYRHAIVALTEYTDFCERLWRREEVQIFALHKKPGNDLGSHYRWWKLLRRLRPALVHTRNLPGLEYALTAACAGVPGRIHGEHGRDVYDLDGLNWKYNLLRRSLHPLIHHYTTVSADLQRWLIDTVRAPKHRVGQIYNGVDAQRFHPRGAHRPLLGPEGFIPQDGLVIGTVGRMQTVKDQLTLVRAFLQLLENAPAARKRVRLIMIGDGPLREESLQLLQNTNATQLAWLPGEREDIPDLLRSLDIFILPSIAEGISNTILEAMASGLPVIATRVGGNPELVNEGVTGLLTPASDPAALAAALQTYLDHPALIVTHGQAGRKKVESTFSMDAMVKGHLAVYDAVCPRSLKETSPLTPAYPVER
ncbi:MAG: TIGR03088 family PEP-CTERM/XrtA system glycosyltransferase [Deltaproteobacteria bacterium]|nr:TIGR03088 family PEP-CTERM/XrtA system glycosyltransferase [Deltaproteobacteria bacterium]